MGEILDIELLGLPPTVNHMYRSGKGIRYKTLEVRQYQQYVVGKLREVWEGRETLMGRIEMHVVFTTNDRRRWDIDNRVKALQDCLSMAGVIRDDSQLDDLRVQRVYGKDKGTRITVRKSVKIVIAKKNCVNFPASVSCGLKMKSSLAVLHGILGDMKTGTGILLFLWRKSVLCSRHTKRNGC